MTIRNYLMLTKPGIIMGNAITAIAGFLLAARTHFDPQLFLATIGGLSLVIASGCVFNNYMDRTRDKKMARTRKRPLVTGAISLRSALIFATLLGLVGLLILSLYTTPLSTLIALTGFIVYVAVYTNLKHRTVHGTVLGSIAGAVPPVVGYCAVTNRFDTGALLLFLLIVLWQMPHFFAIAMYRLKDYAAASIPVLPVVKGLSATKVQMLLYIIAFAVVATLFTLLGYTGYAYLAVALSLSLMWLVLCIQGFKSTQDTRWARQMFIFSLIIVTALSFMISVDGVRTDPSAPPGERLSVMVDNPHPVN